ncbi:hypothetical protein [Leptospira noguchii]|uniref:hypothetical protein n=1 Tax=Leptospira noguchii TaxID=28182 RepID=UPI0015EF2716
MESFKDEILFEIGELEKNKTKDPMIVLKKKLKPMIMAICIIIRFLKNTIRIGKIITPL